MLSDVQMDLLFVMPSSLAAACFLVRMLDMRKPALYMSTVFVLMAIVCSHRSGFAVEMKLTLGAACDFLLPFLFSRGGIGRRVMVIVLTELCLIACEVLSALLWILLTDAPIASYDAARDHFGAFVFMHAVHMAVLVCLLALLSVVLDRSIQDDGSERLWMLVGFPATQCVLLCGVVFVGQYYFGDSDAYYVVCSALAVACLAVDVLFFHVMAQCSAAEAERQRVQIAEMRMEEQYRHCEELLFQAEEAAKFRHDMRNHLQALTLLADRGMRDEARRYARELSERLEAGVPSHG